MWERIKHEFKQGRTLLQFGLFKATGQALALLAPLVIAKFLASLESSDRLAEEWYASYSVAKMVVFLFCTVLIASSQAPFIVFANQEKVQSGKINKTFSVQLTFFVLSFCIFFGVILPLNKYVMALAKIDRADLLFVLLAFVGLALKSFTCNLFMAMNQRIKNSVAEFVFGFLTLSLVLVFYWTRTINLKTVFLIYFVAGAGVACVFVNFVDFNQLRPFGLDREHLKKVFDFAKWVALGSTAFYFINWGNILVLRFLTPMGDVGTYSFGDQIFKGLATLTFVINAYFLPFVSRHIEDSAKMRDYLYNKRPKIFLVGLLAIGLFFLITPYVFKFICGTAFPGSRTVLGILLIGLVFLFYSVFYETLLLALKRYKFTQTVYVLQVVLSIVLALLLVPRMGILGAAVAAVLAYLFRAATMETYFRVKLKKLLNV
ncbi:MAG: MATE family efflux transporter [Planctomycetota bacterium]|jgi:O-antigen/teichoic acid export membrane protein